MTPPQIPIAFILEYGFAALANAKDLLDAARVLHQDGKFGTAMSLAISSREEQGKFMQVMFAVLGTKGPTITKLAGSWPPSAETVGRPFARQCRRDGGLVAGADRLERIPCGFR